MALFDGEENPGLRQWYVHPILTGILSLLLYLLHYLTDIKREQMRIGGSPGSFRYKTNGAGSYIQRYTH
jgi:hypothetical protein